MYFLVVTFIVGLLRISSVEGLCPSGKLTDPSGVIDYDGTEKDDDCEWILPLESYENYVVVLNLLDMNMSFKESGRNGWIRSAYLKLPGMGTISKQIRMRPLCEIYASPVASCDMTEIKQAYPNCNTKVLHDTKDKLETITMGGYNTDRPDYKNSFTLQYNITNCSLPASTGKSTSNQSNKFETTAKEKIPSSTTNATSSKATASPAGTATADKRVQATSEPPTMNTVLLVVIAILAFLLLIACSVIFVLVRKQRRTGRDEGSSVGYSPQNNDNGCRILTESSVSGVPDHQGAANDIAQPSAGVDPSVGNPPQLAAVSCVSSNSADIGDYQEVASPGAGSKFSMGANPVPQPPPPLSPSCAMALDATGPPPPLVPRSSGAGGYEEVTLPTAANPAIAQSEEKYDHLVLEDDYDHLQTGPGQPGSGRVSVHDQVEAVVYGSHVPNGAQAAPEGEYSHLQMDQHESNEGSTPKPQAPPAVYTALKIGHKKPKI